ncbi:MAG: hypothetical protein J7L54_06135 [Elusimicrobia bacterium]|nr:hypothetical protein [Elusimicrobiota bacterium]
MVFGLSRIKDALKKEGFRENFKSILVAGSAGKSQTAVFLEELFLKKGVSVGTYISPHLYRIGERVRINGKEISDSVYYRYISKFKKYKLTYFERLTAAAFVIFAEKGVEWAVVECGLGGRKDATNVLRNKISIITDITLEHTDYLGGTIEKIAFEKAGIIKKGNFVISGVSGPAEKIIKEVAKKKKAMVLTSRVDSSAPYRTRFLKKNFSLALSAFGKAGFEVKNFYPEFVLPVRFEIRKIGATTVVLDGGHTISAAEKVLVEIKKFAKPRICVFSALRDKKMTEILSKMNGKFEKIYCAPFRHLRKMTPEEMSEKIPLKLKSESAVFSDLREGFKKAVSEKPATLLCFGSLFAAARIKREFDLL